MILRNAILYQCSAGQFIRPLVKATMFCTCLDWDAKVAMLRMFELEPRLLAAVDRIVLQKGKNFRELAFECHM